MSSSHFGWDLLYTSVEKNIKTKQDILVCLAHFLLVSNGFRCIGLGDSKFINGSETKTEALPRGWNKDYALRYVHHEHLYNFKATILDGGVMINLVGITERGVCLLQLNTRSVVQSNGTLEEMIPDLKTVVDLIRKQMIDKLVISNGPKEMSSQTESTEEPVGTRLSADSAPGVVPLKTSTFDPLASPTNYGGADLGVYKEVSTKLLYMTTNDFA